MDYVLSLSYGKDSMACLGAIEQLKWPLDRIITADIWATDTIPADLPPMVEFKEYADREILRRWGIKVEHVCASCLNGKIKTYDNVFYHVRKSGKRKGQIAGFPSFPQQPECNGELKRAALRKIEKPNIVSYVGIAADEPKRFKILNEHKKSPLVEIGWSDDDCRKWCEDNGLLSPIYENHDRGGCWFCHNQGVGELRNLRHNYPEYWKLMLKWDIDSPVTFRADGHTVHDFDKRFELEDKGVLIPNDKKFKWAWLTDESIQTKLF